MATYRELVGKKIKKVTSDPSDSIDGQMWYNSTTGAIRGLAVSEGWSSAPNLGQASYLAGSFGTQTAGVRICGTKTPNTPVSNVEHYNGTGWSEETNYPVTGQSISGAGTQTAGIAAGGSTNPATQTSAANYYNGTSWTAANSLPYTANNMASCGLAQNNVIYAVGRDGSSGNSGTNKTITFDGTNFGNGPNINTTRMFNTTSGAGTGTAGLIIGGFIDPSPNNMTNCEEYDGTSWSNTDTLDTGTGFATAWGTQTNAVTQTNKSNYVGAEAYNGTSWSSLPNIGVSSPGGLYGISAGATGDAGWISSLGPGFNQTQEFNRSTNVVTGAAWASGGTYPTNVFGGAAAGNTPAGLAFGGATGTAFLTTTTEYDGSSFSSGGALPLDKRYLAGFGTQTAALSVKGRTSPPGGNTQVATSEEYDGSSWTAGGTASVVAQMCAGSGTQTAGLAFAGLSPPGSPNYTTSTEEYNGSSWTVGGAMGTARANHSGSVGGTQTAALAFFGDDGSTPLTLNTEEYNGTSWSEQNNVPAGRYAGAGAGTQTAGYGFGGYTAPGVPNETTSTIRYDGTSWATSVNMATARGYNFGAGTAPAGIFTIGDFPAANSTEQFTEETETANVKTFSTS